MRVVVRNQHRDITLGRHPDLSLAQVSEATRAKRYELPGAVSPQDASPRSTVLEPVAAEHRPFTFAQAAELYITAHAAGWKHDRQELQRRRSLELHALPTLGSLEVAKIGMTDLLQVLTPIWVSKTETAVKVRGRIELIIAWADQRAGIDRPNPAQWHGHPAAQLPARSNVARPRHHVALPSSELPGFMRTLAAELRGEESARGRLPRTTRPDDHHAAQLTRGAGGQGAVV